MNQKLKFACSATILLSILMTCGCLVNYIIDLIPDEPWRQYSDVAKKAYSQQQYDVAEENYRRAVKEIGRDGTPGGWVGYFLAMVYVQQGKYAMAVDAMEKSFQPPQDESKYASIAEHRCYVGDIYVAWGKFDDALAHYKQALVLYPEEYGKPNQQGVYDFGVTNVYPYLGAYYTQLGEYEKAAQHLKEKLDRSVKIGLLQKDIAIAKNNLAMAYYCAGNDHDAETLFEGAAGLNANAMVGFPEDLAKSLTMLGRIAEHRGQSDKALTFYASARRSLHRYRTLVYKVEEADVLNQIGHFYIKQDKPEKASKAYHEAILLRQATATQTHPNCADAIKGLADVSSYKNEMTSASVQAQAALKILDTALVPSHPRIAPTLIALASIDALAGHPEDAVPLNARLETILQKPLGPWKEDFMDTAAFYSSLLKKANKPAEAARLDQLQARQKDRR